VTSLVSAVWVNFA